MKKVFLSFAFLGLFSILGSSSPCPTGVSTVKSSWWGPSNDTYYTMCSCDVVKGYEASGRCDDPIE